MPRNERRFRCTIVTLVAISALTLGFQNCAEFKGRDADSELSSEIGLDGQGDAAFVKLEPGSASPSKGIPVRVLGNLRAFPAGTRFLWDHLFGNGLTYCEQTSSADKSETVFLCPETGALIVSLIALLPDGSENTKSLELMIADGGNQPPPGPGATPVPINGPALYTQYCSGCHGPIATSEKKRTSLNALNSAISGRSQMMNLSSLSTAQRQAIVQALQ